MTARAASRLACLSASIALAGLLVAACDSTKSPTQASATVTALSVSQPPGTLKTGDTYQLVATATLSTGRTATTGFDVTWASSDETIATVSVSGVVTARADGSVRITATVAAVSASSTIVIRGGRTLVGLVTETAPTFATTIAGAQIGIVDGLYQGLTATSDASGAFSLPDVNGVVRLRVSAAHYEDAEVTADTGTPLTIRLMPVLRIVTDRIEWVRPSPDARAYQGQLTFVQHRTGPATLVSGASIFTSDSTPTCQELRDDDNRLLWEASVAWQWAARTTITLAGGKRYTLKVFDCFASRFPYPTLNAYGLTAEHPY